jgi:catechol 2,3-dioxygenase-like lactoylglutathione lyase family enzyme
MPDGAAAAFDAGEGLRIVLVEARTDVDYDLDHVALRTTDPDSTAAEYERYGFTPAGPGRVEVGGAYVELQQAPTVSTERPLLNHLAVLVDSADDAVADAEELGIEVESTVDAANTYAAFLKGPDGLRIEYVEHKPSFSLR